MTDEWDELNELLLGHAKEKNILIEACKLYGLSDDWKMIKATVRNDFKFL